MGRPKKADGCEMTTLTGSPKMGNQSPVEVDNTKTTTPQIGDEPAKDSLKISSVCNEIKKENPDTCEYEKKVMWCEGQNQGQGQMTSWQPSNQGQSCGGQTHSSDFIEEDMDDILMMLQNDNQSGAGPAKKMRCYGNGYNDLPVTSQHVCKAEMGLQQDQWQFGMNKSMSVSQTQLNLTNRPPPPQYPGYSSSFPPSQISSAMRASPCQSPPRQMPSPGGCMSDSTTAGSPGYVPNGSPMHSPACQFSPNHSPMYNSPSPHSPYDTSSSQGSPYSETMYSQHPFSPDNNYHVTDLSVNVNCGPQPNMASIGSPTRQFSPAYNNGHITGQSMPSQPMTIPHQEGGIINSQDSWYMTGTPSNICHSPSHTNNNNSFPNQESSFRRLENISRINHHFLSGSSCDLHLNQDKDCDGMMSRSDVETEIVNKTLSSMSQGDSYYYVLSDSHSCSNDSGCGSGNFDEFTSCRRMYKRKILDNSEFCDSPQSGNGSVGRFKRHQSEKYWRASVEVEDAFPMTSDKQMLLEHLNKVFQQMTDRCAENRNVQQQVGLTCLCLVDSPIFLNMINLFPKLGMSSIFISIFRIFLTEIPQSKQRIP
ncbi:hypothetical protein DPMN_099814 [Dreissena polymorpha]|uniref:Uncharacterized protein n=1 Tax=Dreissena polymorpha TaxID=45954 RepID=A0A9D4LG56_DREPO|nr:hypothetical protein DPMN_099814 [Dreissena polymorpha]